MSFKHFQFERKREKVVLWRLQVESVKFKFHKTNWQSDLIQRYYALLMFFCYIVPIIVFNLPWWKEETFRSARELLGSYLNPSPHQLLQKITHGCEHTRLLRSFAWKNWNITIKSNLQLWTSLDAKTMFECYLFFTHCDETSEMWTSPYVGNVALIQK